jgi:flagellar assembly protein FliH
MPMILSSKSVRFGVAPSAITLVRDTEAKETLQAAHENGFQKGFEEASQTLTLQFLEQRTQLANLQEQTLKAISCQFASLLEEVRRALPSLAIDVARRALAGTTLDSIQVEAIAKEVLAELAPGTPDIKLRLCPDDLLLVEALAEEFGQNYPGLELVADPNLSSGDCLADSPFGTIDARVAGKLGNIAQALL